jgi:hypothetical protein
MASHYNLRKEELVNQMRVQRCILKFKQFLYSLNRDVRQHCFGLVRAYFENELEGGGLGDVEVQRLEALLQHWQWILFDTISTEWWSGLCLQHARCKTLLACIQIWIDESDVGSDNETLGLT